MPSFQFILKHDSDAPHCSNLDRAKRQEHIDYIQWVPEYAKAEGMDNPKRGILLGNWNEFSGRATDLLEKAGYDIQWEDEWTTCSNCGRLLQTSPDSYGWQPNYIMTDCEILCFECADIPEYLRSIEDNPDHCCFRVIDPEEYGYVRISEPFEFENGWHHGQNDNPHEILKRLHEEGHGRVLFRAPYTGQFDISFETWEAGPDLRDNEED